MTLREKIKQANENRTLRKQQADKIRECAQHVRDVRLRALRHAVESFLRIEVAPLENVTQVELDDDYRFGTLARIKIQKQNDLYVSVLYESHMFRGSDDTPEVEIEELVILISTGKNYGALFRAATVNELRDRLVDVLVQGQ